MHIQSDVNSAALSISACLLFLSYFALDQRWANFWTGWLQKLLKFDRGAGTGADGRNNW